MEHEVVGKTRAKLAAWRHGNPARGLKVIAVAGSRGKTATISLLSEILQEAGSSVMTLTNKGSVVGGQQLSNQKYDKSADAVQQQIAKAKKKNVNYVIIEVTDNLVATHVLPTLPIEMSIVTNDAPAAQELLKQPVNYTVVPSGFSIMGQGVAPHQAINFGTDESAEAQIVKVTQRRKGTEIELVIDHQTKLSVATYLVGRANALNVTAAISAAYVLAADTSAFQEGVARLERLAGNYDYVPVGDALYEVVVDGANTEESIDLVLSSAAKLKRRRLLVAADNTVSGEYYSLIKQMADRLVVVTDTDALTGVESALSLEAAVDLLKRAAKREDFILLIGREFAELSEDGLTKAHAIIAGAKGE